MSLGIAVQGHAGVRVMSADCPMLHADGAMASHAHHPAMDHVVMEHAAMGHADSAHAGVVDSHMGHSNLHEGGAPAHGKHCQHDAGCQSAGQAIASTMIALSTASPASRANSASAPFFRSHTPPLLARPPALA